MRMTRSQAGLAAFVVSVLAALAALLYDLWLYLTGRTTITECVVESPALGAAIVAGLLAGVGGLVVHFVSYPREE